MTHRLLLDTSSLGYRAFFALPETITGPDDRPVNAVHGYLDMTARLYRDRGGAIEHCLDDDWRPEARVAAYPDYKVDRPPDPESLPGQFEVLRALLEAAGETLVWSPGWEADDAIAARCAAAGTDEEIDIVTGDRDLLQLVRDRNDTGARVRVLYTVRGVSDLAVFDEAAVRDKHHVPPQRYADYAMLRGDPSDGLPGVRGVGEKTAATLVAEHDSIPALLKATARLTPALARNLERARDYLEAMTSVVPLNGDVPVECREHELDEARLDELALGHGVGNPVTRLRAARGW